MEHPDELLEVRVEVPAGVEVGVDVQPLLVGQRVLCILTEDGRHAGAVEHRRGVDVERDRHFPARCGVAQPVAPDRVVVEHDRTLRQRGLLDNRRPSVVGFVPLEAELPL